MAHLTTVLATAIAGAACSASVDILNVPQEYTTIQSAIAAAADGDEIVVSPGTYDEQLNLLGKQIVVRSLLGAELTVIRGSASAGSVITCSTGETNATVIQGFRITGGAAAQGGGLWCSGSAAPTVRDCIFYGNTAQTDGGAIAARSGIRVERCRIIGNTAGTRGGGVSIDDAPPGAVIRIEDTLLSGNSAPIAGGGVSHRAGVLHLSRCTVAGNAATQGAAIDIPGGSAIISASIVWGSGNGSVSGGLVTINQSDVQGGWSGTGSGNLDVDPKFLNPAGPDGIVHTIDDDYTLQEWSACVDAGAAVSYGTGRDVLGHPRGIPGNIARARNDLGAYERQTPLPHLMAAEFLVTTNLQSQFDGRAGYLRNGAPFWAYTSNELEGCDVLMTNALGQTFPVAAGMGCQNAQRVHGERVVYVDDALGNKNIRARDLQTNVTWSVISAPTLEQQPDIDGDSVIYSAIRSGNTDIYHVDLRYGIEGRVTTHAGQDLAPRIDGPVIVWERLAGSIYSVQGTLIRSVSPVFTTQDFAFEPASTHRRFPAVSGAWVAYVDNHKVRLRNLGTGLVTNVSDPQLVDVVCIDGDFLAWTEQNVLHVPGFSVYIAHLPSGAKMRLTNWSWTSLGDVLGRRIVYSDARLSNQNIWNSDIEMIGWPYCDGRWHSGGSPVRFHAAHVHVEGSGPMLYLAGLNDAQSPAVGACIRWSGAGTPTTIGTFQGAVRALHSQGGLLFAGGSFTAAGAQSASRVAAWNGTSWSPLGSGLDNAVMAMTTFEGRLIVGGSFTTAGGQSAARIAAWNGTVWSALGSGVNGAVHALAVHDGMLIAGGEFTAAGGVPAHRVAAWNSAQWQPLESGIPGGVVNALCSFRGHLIAGGSFHAAGGNAVESIAAWDGSQWMPLAGGVNYIVSALHTHQDELIAAGEFTMADIASARRVAAWNGTSWRGLGAGMNGPVRALASFGSELIAAGQFDVAGDEHTFNWARWRVDQPAIISSPVNTTAQVGDDPVLSCSASGLGRFSYVWRRNGVPLADGPTPQGSVLEGSATHTLRLMHVQVQDGGSYDVAVTSECGATLFTGVGTLVVEGGCYANCDSSSNHPILNVDDFTCFINSFAVAQGLSPVQQIPHYANCDGSTVIPVLNVDDFTCFINRYALGCP
jgi:hypothetical protein